MVTRVKNRSTNKHTRTVSGGAKDQAMPALDDRSIGWLRYLHRKVTTPDNWDRDGHPHAHWNETTGEPMTSWHRFDLVDSSYAMALMSDKTPA
jgi:hypothetical protein